MFGFENYGLYLLFSLPALLLGLWAQLRVKGAFDRFSQVRTATGVTGAQVARRILDNHGLRNVKVEQVEGFLSDHYDPTQRVLRLSPHVYQGNSLAAAGIAAHESGHALQHQQGYAFLALRSMMVPTVQIGSWVGPLIFMLGFFLAGAIGTSLAWLGVALFAAVAVFALVTLPVEFDASARAKEQLVGNGLLAHTELSGVNAVLNAAALTYVAGAAQAVSTLLYYVFLLGGRRED
ncbi:MAG: zinc metallopeptidase [Chloroflexi bacterium]|nr:zinc metallopeptidase [Chloroflexota bacterium]